MWNRAEAGTGKPLVLLHGIGMSHKAWSPIIQQLSKSRRVIAFDVAGFGDSPSLGASVQPTIHNLVSALERELKTIGIHEPVDIVGNSMGGWMALEAARVGLASSVVAISPAGLWDESPAHVKMVFFSLRNAIKFMPNISRQMMGFALFRELLLAIPIGTGGRNISRKDALNSIDDFSKATDFDRTFANVGRFIGGKDIQVPLTIAFGTKDWLLRKKDCQNKSELPDHVNWLEPRDWGHVPMWKDPQGVANLILKNISA
jgi:pimeloyl-ACP methyl ester carboxylesterase